MLKSILCLFMFVAGGQLDAFKKEMTPLQTDIDAVVESTGARVFSNSKATYLEGYGLIVVLEAMLEPTRNPLFSSAKSPAEVRTAVNQRLKSIQDKLSEFLKQRVTKTESVGTVESLTVIVHISNTNPAEVPDLLKQLVLTVKKDSPGQVAIRPYK